MIGFTPRSTFPIMDEGIYVGKGDEDKTEDELEGNCVTVVGHDYQKLIYRKIMRHGGFRYLTRGLKYWITENSCENGKPYHLLSFISVIIPIIFNPS